jgi:exopolysaccharide biosynthesis polyprenyl glycosylphosphotransferase
MLHLLGGPSLWTAAPRTPITCEALATRAEEPASSEQPAAPPSDRRHAHVPSLSPRRVGHYLAGSVPMRSGAAERLDPSRTRERRYRRLLGLADVLATLFALTLCIAVPGRGNFVSPALIAGVPMVVVIAKVLGLYDRDELVLRKSTLDEAPKVFQLATLFTLGVSIGQAPLHLGELGGDQVLALWVVLFVSLLGGRRSARAVAQRVTAPERCLLIGDPRECERIHAKLAESRTAHAQVVAQIASEGMREEDLPLPFVEELAAENGVDRIVIAAPAADNNDLLDLVRAVKSLGVHVTVLPSLLEVVGSSVVVDEVEGVLMLGVRRFGLTRSSGLLKRGLDGVASALALIFLAPLMAAVALAIKIDSRGPTLFRQQRIGRNGRPFEMLKFRTMVDGADSQKPELLHRNECEGLFKIADDPRITRVGRVLRHAYLDELPQLVNTLRGDMSLVGPRPLVSEDDSRIGGWDRRRLHLTPGITGPWQVTGVTRPPLDEMVKLDYLYVATWSLWGDVKIILRTIALVLSRRGL